MPSFTVLAQASGRTWSCVVPDRSVADSLAAELSAGGAEVLVSPVAGALRADSDLAAVAAAALALLVPSAAAGAPASTPAKTPVPAPASAPSCILVLEATDVRGTKGWYLVPGEAAPAQSWLEGDEELDAGLVAVLAAAKGVSETEVHDDLCEDAFVHRRLARPLAKPSAAIPAAADAVGALLAIMASPSQRDAEARAWLAESGYDPRSAHLVKNGYCDVIATSSGGFAAWRASHPGALEVMPVLL
jgi:hypothetical protein